MLMCYGLYIDGSTFLILNFHTFFCYLKKTVTVRDKIFAKTGFSSFAPAKLELVSEAREFQTGFGGAICR